MAKSKSKSGNDKSKSTKSKGNESKDKKNKPTEKVDSKKRNISIGILVALAIGLIIYAIYCFEAHKNNWFPFINYKPNPPSESVIPTATTDFDPNTEYTDTMGRLQAAGYTPNVGDDDREALAAPNVQASLANNCYWYCQGVLQLPDSQTPLADRKTKPQVGTKLTDFSGDKPKPVGDIESSRTGVKRQEILKPANDTKSKWGCDCDGMDYSNPVTELS